MVAIESYKRPGLPPVALMAVVVLAALAGVVAVRASQHALAKHGAEARQIHQCLDENGPFEIWESRSQRDDRFYQTCLLSDGRWGLRVIERIRDGWRERTSFIVKSGSRQELVEYLTAKARLFEGILK